MYFSQDWLLNKVGMLLSKAKLQVCLHCAWIKKTKVDIIDNIFNIFGFINIKNLIKLSRSEIYFENFTHPCDSCSFGQLYFGYLRDIIFVINFHITNGCVPISPNWTNFKISQTFMIQNPNLKGPIWCQILPTHIFGAVLS